MKNIMFVTAISIAMLMLANGQLLDESNNAQWNQQNKTMGMTCTANNNCTSWFCQGTTCQSPCAIYEPLGNYSTGCYCEKNSDCSSQYCNDRQC
jgi:hypothetical protein